MMIILLMLIGLKYSRQYCNNFVVMDGNCSVVTIMYKNGDSLRCTPENNTIL